MFYTVLRLDWVACPNSVEVVEDDWGKRPDIRKF